MPNTPFLQGYRILDLSQYIPGPFATRQLADLGAEVLKIEPPAGDPMRRFMRLGGEDSLSPIYRHLNRGKRVALIDLKSAKGHEQLSRLLVQADVLLESYRPGVMARLGFDRKRLAAINPRLIHCALSGFGQTGPYRDRAGHDLTYCAITGALSASGDRTAPRITFPPIADHAGAMQAVSAILAALLARARTGKGAFLDISLSESLLAWQYLGLFEAHEGTEPKPGEMLLNGGAACYNLYRTADDRFVALAALEQKFWHSFCATAGHQEWMPRQHEPLPQTALIGEVQTLFAGRTLAHWQQLLGEVDCCFEPIPLMSEVASHPQIRVRRMLDGFEPGYPAWDEEGPLIPDRQMLEIETGNEVHWTSRL